ncbi:hypothetical protein OLZ33_00660 [Pantoea ananatis]|uniref:hypothetical protein n=1 Tax=Pantoea ananas TaxID=553 RepID=UPI002222F0AC|nr:hypothetical protein [Pantoea ananatis]MCW1830512.1 hypothetical protein [Pantoea ananatis]
MSLSIANSASNSTPALNQAPTSPDFGGNQYQTADSHTSYDSANNQSVTLSSNKINYASDKSVPNLDSIANTASTSEQDAQSSFKSKLIELSGMEHLFKLTSAQTYSSQNVNPEPSNSLYDSQSDNQVLSSEAFSSPAAPSNELSRPDTITDEKDNTQIPTEENLKAGRPADDKRSAEEIINDCPALKNLGDQKDIKKDELKQRFGDWTSNNPDAQSRADAAFRMAKVLHFIDNMPQNDGTPRQADGDIQGITHDGDARHGTEAGILKDVAEKGLEKLKNEDGNYALPKGDGHVKADGSNYDNFQWGMKKVGEVFSKIPLFSSLVAPIFTNMGEGNGLGGVLKGAMKGVKDTTLTKLKMAEGFATGGAAGLAEAVGEQAVADSAKIISESKTKSKHV